MRRSHRFPREPGRLGQGHHPPAPWCTTTSSESGRRNPEATPGETLSSLELSVVFALSPAEVHGVPVDEVERRRTIVMGIMLGGPDSATITKVAERTGQHWGTRWSPECRWRRRPACLPSPVGPAQFVLARPAP